MDKKSVKREKTSILIEIIFIAVILRDNHYIMYTNIFFVCIRLSLFSLSISLTISINFFYLFLKSKDDFCCLFICLFVSSIEEKRMTLRNMRER